MLVPLPAGNGLPNWTLSVQAEFLQVLSGFQQAPVCLLESGLTCGPVMTTCTSLIEQSENFKPFKLSKTHQKEAAADCFKYKAIELCSIP